MNKDLLTKEIQAKLALNGFKETKENKAFIQTIAECIINHIQTQAIVNVTTTGTATTQSGIGKII